MQDAKEGLNLNVEPRGGAMVRMTVVVMMWSILMMMMVMIAVIILMPVMPFLAVIVFLNKCLPKNLDLIKQGITWKTLMETILAKYTTILKPIVFPGILYVNFLILISSFKSFHLQHFINPPTD